MGTERVWPADERSEHHLPFDLPSWVALFRLPDSRIVNERDEEIHPDEMVVIIRDGTYEGEPRRHTLGSGFCIAHGPGPWDLLVGEFS